MYRNHEGYADPTAGTAISNIMHEKRKRKRKKAHVHAENPIKHTVRSPRKKRPYNEEMNRNKWIKALKSQHVYHNPEVFE